MKLQMVLKVIAMQDDALRAKGAKRIAGLNAWLRYMQKSRIGFDDFSLVAANCTQLAKRFCKVPFGHRNANGLRAAYSAAGRQRTSGLRFFSKIYRMRGLFPTLRAVKFNGVKFHGETPNVEVTGAARLYRAASSDCKERG